MPVHVNDTAGPITCLSWIPCSSGFSNDISEKVSTNCDGPPYTQSGGDGSDDVWSILTRLPSLSKAYSYNPSGREDTEDCQRLDHGESMSLLIAGTKNGHISLYVNGFLHCAKVDMNGTLAGPSNLSG